MSTPITQENTMDAALAELIQQITSGAQAVVAFGQSQIPDIIQQLLMWELASASLIALICAAVIGGYIKLILVIVAGVKIDGHWAKWRHGDNHKTSDWADVSLFVGGAITAMATAGFLVSAFKALQILIAPKIYLIQYAGDLLK